MKIDAFCHIVPAKYKEALEKEIGSPLWRSLHNALPTMYDLDQDSG